MGSNPIRHPSDVLFMRASFFMYRQSLGEVPLGLPELAVSVTRVTETADGGLKPPRLVAAHPAGMLREELGGLWDIRMAMEDWEETLKAKS